MTNTNNITAATLANIAAAAPMSFEYGKAVARAWIEANTAATPDSLKPGQVVRLVNMPNAKRVVIVGVRSNGIWIRRTATDGEFARRGVEQVKERVRFADIIAA